METVGCWNGISHHSFLKILSRSILFDRAFDAPTFSLMVCISTSMSEKNTAVGLRSRCWLWSKGLEEVIHTKWEFLDLNILDELDR